MSITLGTITFDDAHTDIKEKLEEVGGRNERRITVSGLIVGKESVTEIHNRLDEILDEASAEDYSVPLSIRSGRQVFVRREKFRREVRGDALTGSFVLDLAAKDPLEETITPTVENWSLSGTGDTQTFVPGGNVETAPLCTFTPSADIESPAISDGPRTLRYSGIVSAGETLTIDGINRTVTLNGANVIAYTSGEFPRLQPTGTQLTYTDDLITPVAITIAITHRGRWW